METTGKRLSNKKTQEATQTLNLALSLLTSRYSWLSTILEPTPPQDTSLPHTLISSATLQLGPHIFDDTKFYEIDSDSPDLPYIVLEFLDHPSIRFRIPKDFTVRSTNLDSQSNSTDQLHNINAYFHLAPRHKIISSPSLIKQQHPFYGAPTKSHFRVELRVTNANRDLVKVFEKISQARNTTINSQYCESLVNPNPNIKLVYSYLPNNARLHYYNLRKRNLENYEDQNWLTD